MNTTNTSALTKRINTVRGQLAAIVEMLERNEDCTDVLTQFKASRAGLARAFALFVETNVHRCMQHDAPEKAQKELKLLVAELTQ